MKQDYYVDAILGEWKHNKRKSTRDNIYYERQATLKLHKDFAVPYIDPESFKEYKVHGEVTLTEVKLLQIQTSAQNFFRGVELTPNSIKEEIIK